MRSSVFSVVVVASIVGMWSASPARSDDGTGVRPAGVRPADLRAELEAMSRTLDAQSRRLRELEGGTPTADEVSSTVERYLGAMPAAALVGGGDGGSAGFPLGKKPFIQEGPNSVRFLFRNQVRFESFQYSDDAVGVLSSPADTLSGEAPRDRSGFEIERLYFGMEGTLFCEDVSYQLVLSFDSDTTGNVEKEFMWLDWKYRDNHHLRAGVDKIPFTYEEQNSSASLAFVDRGIVAKAFALDSDTGVMLWGWLGSECSCPKRFLYKAFVSTGEGRPDQAGSVFNTDAFDTYSDNLLMSAMVEWNITGRDWAFDEVDHRACEDRCRLDASLGASAYYENDHDVSHKGLGFPPRIAGENDRYAVNAWFRARWEGLSLVAEYVRREVDHPQGTLPTQTEIDSGAEATLHYRFGSTNWGVGAKYGIIWLDDTFRTRSVANSPPVATADTITEWGFVVNYFFWDHNNKISADVTWVNDNSAVTSSSAGYLADPAKGVLVEDGVLLRIQWQINF